MSDYPQDSSRRPNQRNHGTPRVTTLKGSTAAAPRSLRQKWRRWLKRIERDVLDLIIAQHIYEGIRTIVASNADIQRPGDVYRWISRNYGTAMVVGIRRLTDRRLDSLSLVRLLKDIADHSDAITRESHVCHYSKSGRRGAGDRWFDSFAGRGKRTLPKSIPRSHLRRVKLAAERIRRLVDTRIAHLDQKNVPRKPLKFTDIHNAIRLIEQTTIQYKLLLNAVSPQPSLLPIWQYDWWELFYKPWVKSPPIDLQAR